LSCGQFQEFLLVPLPEDNTVSPNFSQFADIGDLFIKPDKQLPLTAQVFDDRRHTATVSHHDAEHFDLRCQVQHLPQRRSRHSGHGGAAHDLKGIGRNWK
jgi:hypothetical protein